MSDPENHDPAHQSADFFSFIRSRVGDSACATARGAREWMKAVAEYTGTGDFVDSLCKAAWRKLKAKVGTQKLSADGHDDPMGLQYHAYLSLGSAANAIESRLLAGDAKLEVRFSYFVEALVNRLKPARIGRSTIEKTLNSALKKGLLKETVIGEEVYIGQPDFVTAESAMAPDEVFERLTLLVDSSTNPLPAITGTDTATFGDVVERLSHFYGYQLWPVEGLVQFLVFAANVDLTHRSSFFTDSDLSEDGPSFLASVSTETADSSVDAYSTQIDREEMETEVEALIRENTDDNGVPSKNVAAFLYECLCHTRFVGNNPRFEGIVDWVRAQRPCRFLSHVAKAPTGKDPFNSWEKSLKYHAYAPSRNTSSNVTLIHLLRNRVNIARSIEDFYAERATSTIIAGQVFWNKHRKLFPDSILLGLVDEEFDVHLSIE